MEKAKLMAEERVRRSLAAILAADVVGRSRPMGVDEACTRARFNALKDEIVLPALAARLSCVVFEPMMAAMVLKSPVRE